MTVIEEAQRSVVAAVTEPGDWLTGEQRRDAWLEARDATTNELDRRRRDALSPNAVEGVHDASGTLSAAAVEVVHRVASDPGRLTRSWADTQIEQLGEEVYTELVGVTAIVAVIDRFQIATGRPAVRPAPPGSGEPARIRPGDVGDVGAWVSQTTGPTRANVSRTLSLVPETNRLWRTLVDTHYSRGPEFMNLTWDFPLTRPQAELLASRTTVLSECFY